MESSNYASLCRLVKSNNISVITCMKFYFSQAPIVNAVTLRDDDFLLFVCLLVSLLPVNFLKVIRYVAAPSASGGLSF